MVFKKEVVLFLLSPLLLILSFLAHPVFSIFFLVPSLFLYNSLSLQRGILAGILQWTIAFGGIIYWIPRTLHILFGITMTFSVFLYLLTVLMFFGIFHGTVIPVVSNMVRKRKTKTCFHLLIYIVSITASWIALELFRASLFPGINIATLASSWFKYPLLLQGAAFAGEEFISMIVLLANLLVFYGLKLFTQRGSPYSSCFKKGTAFIGIVLTGYGIWSVLVYDSVSFDETMVKGRIVIVQGNVPPEKKWKPYYFDEIIDRYLALSKEKLSPSVKVILWPETSLNFYPRLNKKQTRKILRFCRVHKISIYAGGPDYVKRNGRTFYYNAVYRFSQESYGPVYRKEKLFPFAEYNPLPIIEPLYKKYSTRPFSRWEKDIPLPMGELTAGLGICFESTFPSLMKDRAGGSDILVVFSDDIWLGTRDGYDLHSASLIYRAIENRTFLFHVNNSGPSAVISPRGEILYGIKPGVSAAGRY